MVHQAIVEVLQLDWIEVACASANNPHFNISSIMYGSEAAGEVYYKDSTDQPGSGIQRHTLLNSPQKRTCKYYTTAVDPMGCNNLLPG